MIEALRAAVGEADARVVVRNASAIAELVGPLPLRAAADGGEWLTIGTEGHPHVHLRAADVRALRFCAPEDGNVALEAVDSAGARLLRVAFTRTNPARPDCDLGRRAALVDKYGAACGG